MRSRLQAHQKARILSDNKIAGFLAANVRPCEIATITGINASDVSKAIKRYKAKL